jgi:hypothetical protein
MTRFQDELRLMREYSRDRGQLKKKKLKTSPIIFFFLFFRTFIVGIFFVLVLITLSTKT